MSKILNSATNLHKDATNIRAKIIVLSIALAVLLIVGLHKARISSNLEQIYGDLSSKNSYLFIQNNDYIKGNASSSIIVIEYFDLECPWCKYFHQKLIPMEDDLINKGVAFVYRSYPLGYLHKQAPEEALAHECVGLIKGKDAYFSFMEKVYSHTKGDDTLDLSLLPVFAQELGISKDVFNSCRKASSTIELLNSKISRGASQGINMTPSYVIFNNGKPVYITQGTPTGLQQILNSLISSKK